MLQICVMKFVIVILLAACVLARPEDYSKYEDFDIQELISNERLLKAYSSCFLGEGKCTPEANDFKKWTPDAVQSSCGDCSEKQKSLVAQVIEALKAKLPAEWEKLYKQYDPENKFVADFEEFLKKYNSA